MFDADYFTDLLDKTVALSEKLATRHSREDAEIVKANAMALSCLAETIEDDDVRAQTRERLKSLFAVDSAGAKAGTRAAADADDDGAKEILENDLFAYAKTLRRRAAAFREKLADDEKVVEKTGAAFERNVAQTRSNAGAAAALREKVATPAVFAFAAIVFLATYALIRFF